jgi:hypothetical protein
MTRSTTMTLRERRAAGYRPLRGEGRARLFIEEWTGLGGGFALEYDGSLALIPPDNWGEVPQDDKMLAMFGVGWPGCYKIAARIVDEEGLLGGPGHYEGPRDAR